MGRQPRDSRIETREARARLKPRREPYWRSLLPGRFLGYRRLSGAAGRWILRVRAGGQTSGYTFNSFAVADDFAESDGRRVFSYAEAVEAALGPGVTTGEASRYTVTRALDAYLEHYSAEGKAIAATRAAVEAHIRPKLGHRPIADLTALELRRWLRDLAKEGPRSRARRGSAPAHRAIAREANAEDREEWTRRRRSTANRVLTILKAALNHAFAEGKARNDTEWRRVKPFKKVDQAKIRYLVDDEARRLLNGCDDPAFRQLVHAALLTGCRYGELTRLLAHDVDLDAATVHVRRSKNGEARMVYLNPEGVALFSTLTAGKRGSAMVFGRAGREWRKSEQARPLALACRTAGIDPPLGFHGLRHTYGANLAMRGVPLQVIAQALGHADSRLTERWYAHLSPSYVADTVRANLPRFGAPPAAGQVIPLPRRSKTRGKS